MKKQNIEVRHFCSDWVVFVNENPQFSFMYESDANAVRDIMYSLIECYDMCEGLHPDPPESAIKALEKAGCEL